MSQPFEKDLHVGLSGLELAEDSIDLGEGISLGKTYAHLMASFLMAFKPAPPGQHHPAPWKAAHGGFDFDITAELRVPSSVEKEHRERVRVAKAIGFLIRLSVNPATTMSVLSNHAFADLPSIADNHAIILPFEINPRYFPLETGDGLARADSLDWTKNRWRVADKLIRESAEFALAVDAMSQGQFEKNSALILVSIWGALEALFSPATSELKFRVSSLIAAFLEPAGGGRAALQKDIAKLYDKRSSAAHGKPKHEQEDILKSFELLRRVLIAIIENQKIPSKDDLEGSLFGVSSKVES
jgi:hypothetical protein